jgi:NAD(P)-dependent dehydrogenase (short-subunit alcohol dehydrogenase family)/acyl carrier protein
LFGIEDTLTDERIRCFEARGDRCFLVSPGASYSQTGEFRFTVNPVSPADFAELFAEVIQRSPYSCRGVVHLWSEATGVSAGLSSQKFEEIHRLGCFAILHALQALVKTAAKVQPRLWIVTRCAQHLTVAPRSLSIDQAMLWGMGRVIAWEHPELWGGLIDLDADQYIDEMGTLYEEFTAGDGEDQVAYRDGKRYVARLVSGLDRTLTGSPMLKPEASYVVTGGLGSLGMRVAQWLIQRGVSNLILLGRSAPSEEKREEILKMASGGAQVKTFCCDVANEEQLAAVLSEIERSMPPIRGVIHAAGILDDGILMMQTAERFTRVMDAKVTGAWNLHIQTARLPLDFFVLFSSAASLLGSPGQGNYAAGNAFLDGLAQHRRLGGLPAISINWGPWAEAGMAADLARRSTRQWIPEGVRALSMADGLAALGGLLNEPLAQVAVMPVDWPRFLGQFPETREPRVLARIAAEASRSGGRPATKVQSRVREDLISAPSKERRAFLIAYLQRQVGAVMGLSTAELPEPDQGFFEMGLDSLMALELKNRLSTVAGKDLPASLMFNYPNIAALADYVLSELLPEEGMTAGIPDSSSAITEPRGHKPPSESEDELLDSLAAEVAASEQLRAAAHRAKI